MSNAGNEAEAIVIALYESIWAISDVIGFNIEVAKNRIPKQYIEPDGLALRLLVDGTKEVSSNLALLQKLEHSLIIEIDPNHRPAETRMKDG